MKGLFNERRERQREREREREKRLAYARLPTTTGVPPAEINRGLIIIILFSPGLERPRLAGGGFSEGGGTGERWMSLFNSWERDY